VTLHSVVKDTKVPEDDSPTYNAAPTSQKAETWLALFGKTDLHTAHHQIWKAYFNQVV